MNFNHKIFANKKLYFILIYLKFNFFIEKTIKVEDAYTVLKGHRSIVNHVNYSEQNNMLISSGVEKIIKVFNFIIIYINKFLVLEFI